MRRFSGRLIAAALAIAAGFLVAQWFGLGLGDGAAPDSRSATATNTSAEAADAEVDGNALVARVLAALERYPNLTARFRETLRIGDDALTGIGEYWQQGVGNTRRTCWQWQTLVEGQKAVFCQVLDKNGHLWTDRRFPGGRRLVTRVDVDALNRQLSLVGPTAEQGRGAPAADDLVLLARGGMSQLVAELRSSYDFGRPQAIAEDGKTLLAVIGRWRQQRLIEIWPSAADQTPADWPAHLPHHVVLKIGHKDLVPYGIEYRRGADAAEATSVAAVAEPLARFEFFDVRWGVVMPDRLFEFAATDVDWRDVTESVRWRLAPPTAKAEPAVARREGAWRR